MVTFCDLVKIGVAFCDTIKTELYRCGMVTLSNFILASPSQGFHGLEHSTSLLLSTVPRIQPSVSPSIIYTGIPSWGP